MNPAIILIGGLLILYAAATGRMEAVFKALVDAPTSATRTKSSGSGGSISGAGGSNDATKGGAGTSTGSSSTGGGGSGPSYVK